MPVRMEISHGWRKGSGRGRTELAGNMAVGRPGDKLQRMWVVSSSERQGTKVGEKMPGAEWTGIEFLREALLVFGIFLFFGRDFFHHLALAVAVQFRTGFVLAMCGVVSRIEPIVRHDPGSAERLGHESQKYEETEAKLI